MGVLTIQKLEAKEFLIKSKVYRAFAYIFAFAGVFLAGFILTKKSNGNVMEIVSDPISLVVIISAFVPSLVFSLISKQAEKKLKEYKGESESKSGSNSSK